MTDTLEVITKILREEVERSSGLTPLPVRTMLMRVVDRLEAEAYNQRLAEIQKGLDGVKLDPDVVEMHKLIADHAHQPVKEAMVLTAIKRGRELERAVMGNPIPEQIQEVTPPQPVDPDLAEAEEVWFNGITDIHDALAAIKRGRELERREAKPKLFWGNHDGTGRCPVDREAWVIVQYPSQFMIGRAGDRDWRRVSRYAEFDADGAVFEEGE